MEFDTFRVLQRYALLSLLLMPVKSWSLGLGDVTVESRLDYPLQAKIELLAARSEELATLSTKLASARDFDWVGIKRPEILHKLEFGGPERDGDSLYVTITTKEPIREPILNFLVEAQWAAGRLLREYTINLQPADILSIKQRENSSEQPFGSSGENKPTATRNDIPPLASPSKVAVDDQDIYHPGESAHRPTYRSVPGDTLSTIAKKFLPQTLKDNKVNRLRMMIALLEANPHAFIDNNINALKSNAELLIPPPNHVEQLNRERVVAEVKRQNDRWRNKSSQNPTDTTGLQDIPLGNSHSAATPPSIPESYASQKPPETAESEQIEASINTSDEEKSESEAKQAAPGSNTDQLQEDRAQLTIVSEQEPLEETGSLTVASTEFIVNLERSVTLAQELAESRRLEAEEVKSRVARLEAVIAQQERLITLQNDQLSELNRRFQKMSQPQEAPASNHWLWIISAIIAVIALLILYIIYQYIVRKQTPTIR